MTCEEARLALGAYVLGALDADEAAEVEEHIRDCDECRAEHEELRDMPRLLGLVTLEDAVDGPAAPTATRRDELIEAAIAVRRGERRRRASWTTAGGVAIAAAAAAIGFGLGDAAVVDEVVDPDLQVLAASDPTTGVRGQVELDGVAWGTRLALELAGVSSGETCSLVAVSSAGNRETTATWTVPAATPDSKYLTVPGAAGLTPDRIDAFEIVTSDGSTVLSLSFADLVAAEVPAG